HGGGGAGADPGAGADRRLGCGDGDDRADADGNGAVDPRRYPYRRPDVARRPLAGGGAAGPRRHADNAALRLPDPIRHALWPGQQLWTVQVPLALPAIMAGVNQTTMMALSMVVIASMIGAGGLGYQVLQGIQRLEVSRGLLAGLGIVFLAIIFDRIAQSYGRR